MKRREFLNTSILTVAGLAVAPKFIFGQTPDNKSITTNIANYKPEDFNLRLSKDPIDAFKLQNDMLGVRLWGPITQPTLSIGKSDIWDRRWFNDRQPLVTMKQIREYAKTGRIREICPTNDITVCDVYNKYDFPCPKTGGQLILGVPFATDTRFKSNEDGSVTILITGNNKKLIIDIWVTLLHPMVVIECSAEGLNEEDFCLRTYRHQDSIKPGDRINPTYGNTIMPDDFERLPVPETYTKGNCWGIKQKFIPEKTFPEGFECALLSTCIRMQSTITEQYNKHDLGTALWAEKEGRLSHGVVKRYTPINESAGSETSANFNKIPGQFTILSMLETTQDNGGKISKTVSALKKFKKRGVNYLWSEQKEALENGKRKERANASVGDKTIAAPLYVYPNIRKAGGYYGDIPMCSVGTTKFCFQDSSPWHGDFHFNELNPENLLILGQFEDIYLYCETIHNLLPGAIENARDVYDLPGAMYTVAHFPIRTQGLARTNLTWDQDFGMNGLICKPLWLYYKYTGDVDFLKKIAYPVLKECAKFMNAYFSEGDDGKLHIIPTVSPEHWGITNNFERNKDGTSAITMTRYLLRSAIESARILGIDKAEAATWENSLKKLVDYPTYQTETGPIWVDVKDAPPIPYNIPNPLSPVFWGDDVGLDSPVEDFAIAKRTAEQIQIPGPHNPYLDLYIRPRLGIWNQGAPINAENLLQSYQSIHIFPAVPPSGAIEMENFAAEGGFRISARRTENGKIFDVKVKSNVGGICRISNPWKGKNIKINKGISSVPHTIEKENDIIRFNTKKGEVYHIDCSLG